MISQTAPLAFLTRPDWQMGSGERAALIGLLADLRPGIAIELGTHLGGSLGVIGAWSDHVHSFDLTAQVDPVDYANVDFHIGDSHQLLPRLLDTLPEGAVQFALVDGDHSPGGARQDLLDLLESPAMGSGAIVMHDAGNEAVRRGLRNIPYARFPHVARVDLDFVPPDPQRGGTVTQVWGGFGLVLIDRNRTGPGATPPSEEERRDLAWYLREARRITRRLAGLTLRRLGVHPAQRNARR